MESVEWERHCVRRRCKRPLQVATGWLLKVYKCLQVSRYLVTTGWTLTTTSLRLGLREQGVGRKRGVGVTLRAPPT